MLQMSLDRCSDVQVWWLSLATIYNQLSQSEMALFVTRLLSGLLPLVLILSAPGWYQRHRDLVVVFLRLNTLVSAAHTCTRVPFRTTLLFSSIFLPMCAACRCGLGQDLLDKGQLPPCIFSIPVILLQHPVAAACRTTLHGLPSLRCCFRLLLPAWLMLALSRTTTS